jgi:hypothetical protein
MADLSGNSCNIVTLLPLGIDCDTINASTPASSNGYMAVLITGGTPPYTVSWSNGAQGTYITNLIPGDYTVNVTDYYGDFSASTTCTVGYESFFLEKFQKCSSVCDCGLTLTWTNPSTLQAQTFNLTPTGTQYGRNLFTWMADIGSGDENFVLGWNPTLERWELASFLTLTTLNWLNDDTDCPSGTIDDWLGTIEMFTSTPQCGEVVYYLRSQPSLFTLNKIYKLTSQMGCWKSLGSELNSGQTFINQVAVKSAGPYNSCLICNSGINILITPQIYRGPLCFTRLIHPATLNQTTYYSGNTINNYPSWTAGTQTIYYNSGTTRWTISGWSSSNVPYLQSPNTPPVGTWTTPGAFISNINVTTGVCTTSPLQISVQTQNPACSTSYGSATVNVIGGTAPYTYSLDNINFTSNNFLTNLAGGPYTVYVKDSSPIQNSGNQTFSIVPVQNFVNYLINVNFVEPSPLSNTTTQAASFATLTKNTTFTISLTPTQPFNQPSTVQFDLVFDISTTGTTNATDQPIINNTIVVTGSTGTTLNLPTSTTPTSSTTINNNCAGGQVIVSGFQTTYSACLITNNTATIGGTISQYIYETCASTNSCTLRANSLITLQVRNISITPLNCQGIDSTIITRSTLAQKTGPTCPTVL